ncbi:MAG: GNAT family N-acetyltransferase [Coriobacteriia bacterium]|nr:GNAT family N-acetyltransferase [Coriobacteriia bacterium]
MSGHEFRFERLTSKHDVRRFDCGDSDLNEFLQCDALPYQEQHLAGTYLVFDGAQLVAYFSIAADAIKLELDEPPTACIEKAIRTYPALKLARLGVHKEHQGRGIGNELVKVCVGVAIAMHQRLHVGCRFVTVDAYPDRVDWYLQRGFERNKAYVNRRNTASLRLEVIA